MKDFLADPRSDITCFEAVWVSNKVIQRRYSICLGGLKSCNVMILPMKALLRWSKIPDDSGLVGCTHVFCRAGGRLMWHDEVHGWEGEVLGVCMAFRWWLALSAFQATLYWTSRKELSNADWLRLSRMLSFSLSQHHKRMHFKEVRWEIGEDDVCCTISGRKCCEMLW